MSVVHPSVLSQHGPRATYAALIALLLLGVSPILASAEVPSYRLTAWPSAAASPDFSLTDDEGQARTLRDYRGKVIAVVFGFMSCPEACPTELLKLSLAIKKMGRLGKGVQVLFVTLDPSRDTGPMLKQFVTTFDTKFVGLTGSATQIDRTAALFRVQYARVITGDTYTIDHSTAIYVFDKKGKLRLLGAYETTTDDFAEDFTTLALQH